MFDRMLLGMKKMADDELELVGALLLSVSACGALALMKKKHKVWVNKYLLNRRSLGTFHTLLPELCVGGKYFQYLRME